MVPDSFEELPLEFKILPSLQYEIYFSADKIQTEPSKYKISTWRKRLFHLGWRFNSRRRWPCPIQVLRSTFQYLPDCQRWVKTCFNFIFKEFPLLFRNTIDGVRLYYFNRTINRAYGAPPCLGQIGGPGVRNLFKKQKVWLRIYTI